MTPQADPFRTLGVAPGASLNEIKSAYRRLAKQFHPDAAGERALPRFLAIQAAYESLVDDRGRLRGTPSTAARPWEADASRARATREAYRARRAGRAEPGAGPGASQGPPGARGGARSGGSAGRSRSRDTGEPRRRAPRKATPGSTTYDEAREVPRDPEWEGAEWYGPSLGTYWTINPREYADPRKHGPEYQARARRAARDDTGAERGTGARSGEPGSRADEPAGDPDDPASWRWSARDGAEPGGRTGPGVADWSARHWRYRSAGGPDARAASPTAEAGRSESVGERPWAGAGQRAGGITATGPDVEAIVALAAPARLRARAVATPSGRLLVALIGWPPLGLLAASVIDLLTGCSGLAATCAAPAPWLPVAAQPVIILALAALPVLAAVAAFATLASLAVVVPATVALSASGVDDGDAAARLLVAGIATASYLVAWGFGAASLRRSRHTIHA